MNDPNIQNERDAPTIGASARQEEIARQAQPLGTDQSPDPAELRRILRIPLRARISLAVVILFGVLVWALSQTANLVQVVGHPFWPTDPEVHPPSGIVETSLNPFFTIKNGSSLFDISNAEFICGIDLLYLEDATYRTLVLRDVAFFTGRRTVLAGNQVDFECDARAALNIQGDGTMILRGAMRTPASDFRPPLKILKLCQWVGINYSILGVFKRRFKTAAFQWPTSTKLHQWTEGAVVRDPLTQDQAPAWPPSAAWAMRGLYKNEATKELRSDALECSANLNRPYGLFVPGEGRARFWPE